MNQYAKSLVLVCLLVTSVVALGAVPIASASRPAGDVLPQATISAEQISDLGAFDTDNAFQQNTTNASQIPTPVPPPGPSLPATRETEAGDNAELSPPVHSQRVTTNHKYNQSNSSSGQAVVYNGTDQRVTPSNGSKDSAIQSTTSTQDTDRLFQSSSPPIDRSLNPTINDGIIGPDERVSVGDNYDITAYPWSSIARLYLVYPDGTRGACSGAIISGSGDKPSAHVLTAAHCVHSSDRGGWIDITGQTASYVSPGADGSREPFGRVGIQNVRSYDGWLENENPAYDLALITLDERIGSKTGSLGYVGIDSSADSVYTHTPTRVTGYPGDKEWGTMWTSTGDGQGTYNFANSGGTPEDIVHRYAIDTSGGMSGGPAWVEDHPAYNGRPIVSVHAYAVDTDRDSETDVTQGTRITRDRFNDIQSWIAKDSVGTPTNDRFEPNDDFTSATQLTTNKTVTDLSIVNGEFDVFAINLSSGDQITADSTFDHSQGDLDMGLYAPTQKPISGSTSDTNGERIEHEALENGTHYVAVYGVDGATAPYSLSLNVSKAPDTDDTPTAARTIDSTTVSSGGSTIIRINTTATSSDLQLQEKFDPQFANVTVVNDSGASTSQATNASVAASWSKATNATLVYEVVVPETAAAGAIYNISGTVEDPDMGLPVTITGNTTVKVSGTCRYPAYLDSDCAVGASDLVDAAADFRAGIIGAGVLFDIAAAFRTGTTLR